MINLVLEIRIICDVFFIIFNNFNWFVLLDKLKVNYFDFYLYLN